MFFQNFYITSKLNQDLNKKFETRFPRADYEEHIQEIWYKLKQYQLRTRCSKN